MPQLPRGVPYVDLLLHAGSAAAAADLQTRIDLVSGGTWTVLADDGTMEQGLMPMQPVRGRLDRVQVYRNQPLLSGEPLQAAASMAVELALETQAKLAALGVCGVYAWGVVLVEDVRWLHGLILLDWLYNPRLDEAGEVLQEAEPDPAEIEGALTRKLAVFQQLWTPARSAAFAQQLPQGALQEVESHFALMLLGPGGSFDPRYWQGFAMQLAVTEVRALAARGAGAAAWTPGAGGPASGRGPGAGGALGVAAGGRPGAAPGSPAPTAPAGPSDGLTPLARAERDAERRRREAAAAAESGAAPAAEAPPPPEPAGPRIRWVEASGGPLVWIPGERLEASFVRGLRDGNIDGLSPSERPSQEALEAWQAAGAAFASEVPLLSRLFLDGTPMHRGSWDATAVQIDGRSVVQCHVPRVAPVLAVLVPPEGGRDRRVLVCSRTDLHPSDLVALAPPE